MVCSIGEGGKASVVQSVLWNMMTTARPKKNGSCRNERAKGFGGEIKNGMFRARFGMAMSSDLAKGATGATQKTKHTISE